MKINFYYLAKTLRVIAIIICVLLASATMYMLVKGCSNTNYKDSEYCEYHEFQARFRNYIVEDKYKVDTINYYVVTNPVNNVKYKINIPDYIYYNIYYVGDTIR